MSEVCQRLLACDQVIKDLAKKVKKMVKLLNLSKQLTSNRLRSRWAVLVSWAQRKANFE